MPQFQWLAEIGKEIRRVSNLKVPFKADTQARNNSWLPFHGGIGFAVSTAAKRGQVFEVFDHLGQGNDQVSESPTPVSSLKLAMSRS